MSFKPIGQSYAQAFQKNIKDIVKIKENFLNLSAEKVEEVHKVLNNSKKDKSEFNMTTKGPFRKQVIIPMSLLNTNRFMAKSNQHVTNINRFSKDVKSDVLADFICTDNKEMIITTNKVATNSNLKVIENYIKNVDEDEVMSPRLSQSKSYLKILDISYYIKDTNLPIIPDIIEKIIQATYIFNDVVLISQPHIIKVSPKSDLFVIWVDI